MNDQSSLQRRVLLSILAIEGVGGISGGLSLILSPNGDFMNMPTRILHGVFPDFFIPGIILFGLGILNILAFILVFIKNKYNWVFAGIAFVGFVIWFAVEILVLREIHWLQIVWGTPVLIGIWSALPLVHTD